MRGYFLLFFLARVKIFLTWVKNFLVWVKHFSAWVNLFWRGSNWLGMGSNCFCHRSKCFLVWVKIFGVCQISWRGSNFFGVDQNLLALANFFWHGSIFFGVGKFFWLGLIFFDVGKFLLAWVSFRWHGSVFFWHGSNCAKSNFDAAQVFYSRLESSFKVDYLKIASKLEGLSRNCRKTQKTIKNSVFSCIAFKETKGPCVNAMRNSSQTSCVITGHLFTFNWKMDIVLYISTKFVRLFRAITANDSLISIRHLASCCQFSQEQLKVLSWKSNIFFSKSLHTSEV